MAWYCEILGENEEVLESSEAVYPSAFEAKMAGYKRVKEKLSLVVPLPMDGWTHHGGGLRSIATIGPKISVRSEASEGPS